MKINPYLNFNGNTEEAFKFYKSVFGGEFTVLQRFKDTPGSNVPSSVENMIMHVALPLGKNVILMGTDAPESMGFKLTMGNNFYISIDVESKAEADKLYKALSKGGKIEMALSDAFWGAYFGSFTDKYGVQWMISFDKRNLKK